MTLTQLSGYRLMWIFVMFDLPVTTKAQNRAATKFREFLRRIEANLPDRGDVHILTFTDKQYENIVRFSGQRRRRQKKNPDQLALF